MVMRVGGIASGMDIEAMVNKLMEAERMPLERLRQEETRLTWKRDAFRDINKVMRQLDDMLIDLKLTRTYNPRTATSSLENAVRVTAESNVPTGSYEISVQSLASNEMQVSDKLTGINLNSTINDINTLNRNEENPNFDLVGTHVFYTFDDEGNPNMHQFEVEADDTLHQVINKIGEASDGRVRAFFDENSNQFVLETTRTGVYNKSRFELDDETTLGAEHREIVFVQPDGMVIDDVEQPAQTNIFTGLLQLGENTPPDQIKTASNAEFTYNNGLKLTSQDNSYTLNGITFEFLNVTEEGQSARVNVNADVDTSFDSIKKFVDKYNELIDMMNGSQTEQRYRDYHPLSEEQKAEMTDKQIEQWEERAKSGILRGESAIRDSMYSLRQSLQGVVDTDGEYSILSLIGIETSENYLDGGRLTIDEDTLKGALRDHPEDVYKLFAGEDGLIHRFDTALDHARGRIESQAGGETSVGLEGYSIGTRMKELNDRISDFERRMIQVEQRYWNQFTRMEKAISNLNQQSSYLFSQFGGM